MMFTLQIEHRVCDFDSWEKAFDRYNPFREESCANRYRLFRSIDNPNYVIINLDFDRSSDADIFLSAMSQLWSRVEGKLIDRPQVRIVEALERKAHQATLVASGA
jgi:hypothetical protein